MSCDHIGREKMKTRGAAQGKLASMLDLTTGLTGLAEFPTQKLFSCESLDFVLGVLGVVHSKDQKGRSSLEHATRRRARTMQTTRQNGYIAC